MRVVHRLKKQLRTILEVHGVVVIPLSAPDKAVFFKDFYYLSGYLIAVGEWYIFFFTHASRTVTGRKVLTSGERVSSASVS